MGLFRRKIKSKYLSIKEIQQIMREDRWMPTAIFFSRKERLYCKAKNYIWNLEEG